MKYTIALSFIFLCLNVFGQNTVGVIQNNMTVASDGYTLLYPLGQSNVYLINNCGQVVHEWIDSIHFRPGNSVYLLDNGDLMKTKRPNGTIPGSFSSGGSGGIVERVTWDNELLWSKQILDATFRAHHDVEVLPNGNVLIIVWQRRSRSDFIQEGGDTTLFDRMEIWPDIIQEYDPVLDSVVWVWDSWNHLVQDFDSTKDNFGEVSSKPGKINLNYDLGGFGGRPDWIHSNAIDYNEDLDQILISASHFEEIWIIDHSTTTEEAKGNTGGISNRGGQLLFRWGNPRAYENGDINDKKLFFQHDVQWLDDPELINSEFYQKIGLFNNRIESDQSSFNILIPEFNSMDNEYKVESGKYLPNSFSKAVVSSDILPFQSSNMSSMQLLSNGHFLICAAQKGRVLEIDENDQLVWDYILPFRNGLRISQGSMLNTGDNVIFRAKRYESDHPAFIDRTLMPQYFLELEPSGANCNIPLNTNDFGHENFVVFPNPSNGILNIRSAFYRINEIDIVNSFGILIEQFHNLDSNFHSINTTNYRSGVYYLRINKHYLEKLIILD